MVEISEQDRKNAEAAMKLLQVDQPLVFSPFLGALHELVHFTRKVLASSPEPDARVTIQEVSEAVLLVVEHDARPVGDVAKRIMVAHAILAAVAEFQREWPELWSHENEAKRALVGGVLFATLSKLVKPC